MPAHNKHPPSLPQLYSKVKPREVLASTLTSLARTMAEGVATTFRGSLICASKTGSVPDYVPVRFAVEPLADSPINVGEVAKQGDVDPAFLGLSTDGKTEGFLIRVWSANWVNGHVGVARDGTIRTFDRASEVGQAPRCIAGRVACDRHVRRRRMRDVRRYDNPFEACL